MALGVYEGAGNEVGSSFDRGTGGTAKKFGILASDMYLCIKFTYGLLFLIMNFYGIYY